MIKKISRPTGSILIWTVLLGICLMTVFFYFSQRLNLNAAIQSKTLERQNAQQFLESYAHYLQSLPLNTIQPGQINFEGITGFVSNVSSQITGTLDASQMLNYEVKFGKAKVEWGRCAEKEEGRPLEVTPNEGFILGNCTDFEYDGLAEVSSAPFTLKAGEAPVAYRITPIGAAILYDDQWTMNLKIMTSSKKSISIHRAFNPS